MGKKLGGRAWDLKAAKKMNWEIRNTIILDPIKKENTFAKKLQERLLKKK